MRYIIVVLYKKMEDDMELEEFIGTTINNSVLDSCVQ